MKQAQNARKQRGRSNARQNNKGGNQGNRSEQKIRGNPKQLVEKYKNQAREALQAGDRTQAEYFFQFADHYQRVLNDMRGPAGDGDNAQNNRRRRRGRGHQDDQASEVAETGEVATNGETKVDVQDAPANGADPDTSSQPIEVHPELDLAGDAPKPAPRRRRTPRKKPEATESVADVAESDVA